MRGTAGGGGMSNDHDIKCGDCGRRRTAQDAYDYNPLQVVTGQRLGWYSAKDGELCPECMTKLIGGKA